MENPFDEIPDMSPRDTIDITLAFAFVNSKEPLVLVMRIADAEWNPDFANGHAALEGELAKTKGDASDALMDGLYARTVIVDWKNCNAKDRTTPLPYSPEMGVKLFAELRKKGLKRDLNRALLEASNVNRFRASAAEAAAALGK